MNKNSNNSLHRYSHKAMATIFEIIISNEDKDYAEQAAFAAFDEIDRLELELSKFHPNSDISKINSLIAEDILNVSLDTFNCISDTKELYKITNGLFDISAGEIIDYWKNLDSDSDDILIGNIGMDKILLDESTHSLKILSNDLTLDLGGFGKGYAIDSACELLLEWEIQDALVHGGGSSVKAIGKLDNFEGWPISISNPTNSNQTIAEIILINETLSGSGLKKGTHIINPKTGQPVSNYAGAWALSKLASHSDAMSTTFMIMQINEVKSFCTENDFVESLVVLNKLESITTTDIYSSENFKINKMFI